MRNSTTPCVFTPLKSKSKPETKACICNWGQTCIDLKVYFKSINHPLGGRSNDFEYTNTCESQNLWNSMCSFIHPSKEDRDKITSQYQTYTEDPDNNTSPRYEVAKHHFPLEIVLAQSKPKSGNWTTPMTRTKAEGLKCYANRGKPFYSDGLFRFNIELGDGGDRSDSWKKDKQRMIRKTPCADKDDVRQLAARLQSESGGSASRGDSMNAKREAYQRKEEDKQIEKQIRKERRDEENRIRQLACDEENRIMQLELQEAEQRRQEEDRTPEEWKAMLSQRDYRSNVLSEENKVLSADNGLLKQRSEQLLEELELVKRKRNAERMNITRSRDSPIPARYAKRAKDNDVTGAGWNKVSKLLSKCGGLSRLTIFNDEWHQEKVNTDAARKLWGYPSWEETKLYIGAYFPREIYDVDTSYDPSKCITTNSRGEFVMPDLTAFESCLLCRLFFRTFTDQEILGLIFGRHRTRVGQILKVWGQRWGNVGEDMSCLDITRDYLFKEVPDINVHLGRPKLVNTDGKDALIAPKRNDSTISRATFSSKTEKDSMRWLAFSTAAGLVFEKTSAVAARSGERSLVRWWGSLGPKNACIDGWEDIASTDAWTLSDDTFWTALENFINAGEYESMLEQLDSGCPLVSNGTLDDGILLTAQPTGLSREGLAEATNTEDSSDDEAEVSAHNRNDNVPSDNAPTALERDAIESAQKVFNLSMAHEMFEEMVNNATIEQNQRDSGQKKRPPVLTPKTLEEQAQKALRNDPNMSGKTKLRQLERHQRLHLLYESNQLTKCIMSYYLLVEQENRLKLLSWMGSKLAGTVPKPTREELPHIPLRLAKIPEDCSLGGDKGFTGIEKDLPNLNYVDTPVQVTNSKTHRLSADQMKSDIPITTVRAPCETIFKRTGDEAVLNEKIPYFLIPFLPAALCLAHGEANIRAPLRYPGRNSIVGQDYWQNVKEYTRISQPKQEECNVEHSLRRTCKQCKTGGIVRLCANCNKWYHIDGSCHDFSNCNIVRNPYN